MKNPPIKSKFVGKKTVWDYEGNVMDVDIIELTGRRGDVNFTKVFLNQFLATLDELTSKRMKVALYVLEHMSTGNRFIGTQGIIAKELGVSRKTVNEAFKILRENDFLRQTEVPNVYLVSAAVACKTDGDGRANIMYRYNELPTNERPEKSDDHDEPHSDTE